MQIKAGIKKARRYVGQPSLNDAKCGFCKIEQKSGRINDWLKKFVLKGEKNNLYIIPTRREENDANEGDLFG